ncbi:MAG: hypothetical protein PHU81_01175 [Acidobacteriota bacterium]|nr:hypothetical protein [Acidobacteriota bacterium]
MFLITHKSLGIRAKKAGREEREEETERILKLRTRQFMKGENGVAGGSSINKPVQNQVSSSTIEISKAGGTTVITNTGASILSVGSTGTYYVYSFDGKLLSAIKIPAEKVSLPSRFFQVAFFMAVTVFFTIVPTESVTANSTL